MRTRDTAGPTGGYIHTKRIPPDTNATRHRRIAVPPHPPRSTSNPPSTHLSTQTQTHYLPVTQRTNTPRPLPLLPLLAGSPRLLRHKHLSRVPRGEDKMPARARRLLRVFAPQEGGAFLPFNSPPQSSCYLLLHPRLPRALHVLRFYIYAYTEMCKLINRRPHVPSPSKPPTASRKPT